LIRIQSGAKHGTQIFEEGIKLREEGDAQTQEGHAQERRQRQEGQEPQAGDCHRIV
jgi:hypothetical protein